ncbi:pentapeptide repeat-containing protein [Maridesulfovibrio sp.]|uniref:pentapeptide repeat-containing protein n=1 Tax=Maridesulfovibrio sp. TaxID=2795000 RepID=UPI0029CA8DDC|nr:pentapeptide repeat-containing protein [Maridesulfovibrio sp.]
MANPEHLKILEQGVEVWNKWREENPEIYPQLECTDLSFSKITGINLKHANLMGTNLESAGLMLAQLDEADIRRANLKHTWLQNASLKNTDLRGANLKDADLDSTNLQRACLSLATLAGATVRDANLQNAQLGGTYLKDTQFTATNLAGADLNGANLERTDFLMANLKEACLLNAECKGTDFRRTNLTETDFSNAIIEETNFTDANLANASIHNATINKTKLINTNLKGAHLTNVHMTNTEVQGVKFDNTMKCRGINIQGCYGSQRFVRHVMDLDYIEETQKKHPKFYWWWKITSDCGRSFERWAMWSIGFALSFGVAFANYPAWSWLPDWMKNFLTSIAPAFSYSNPGIQDGWFTPYYFSIVTFTTLGFGDVTPTNTAGQLWLTAEVTLGYIMLGGLITLFANKMVRQSG